MTPVQLLQKKLSHSFAFFVYGMIFCAALWLGSVILSNEATSPGNFYEQATGYKFIDPLLTCADVSGAQLEVGKSQELKSRVTDLIKELQSNGSVTDAGIYFRQLHDGPRFGINEDLAFTPGSLLKVPLAMGAYSLAESDPQFLAKTIEYKGDFSVPSEHYVAPVIKKGEKYTVESLVRASVVNSDNAAAYLLGTLMGTDNINDVFTHLGVKAPIQGNDYETTVGKYAAYFRILFTATYLSRADSEHLLSLLTQTPFTQGLVAGVPKGIAVAHKFGERSLDDSNLLQLHDCGIVYAKNNPYLLCVMLRGNDFDTLAKSIGSISSLVYNYVD